jgi:hypothetical protein
MCRRGISGNLEINFECDLSKVLTMKMEHFENILDGKHGIYLESNGID